MKKLGLWGIIIGVTLCVVATHVMAQDQITLRVSDWHLSEGVWNKPLKEATDLFSQQHPGVKVTLESVTYGEKETKYQKDFEKGTAPDIYRLHAFSLNAFSSKGYTMDLTPFIEKEGAEFLKPWYPLTLDLTKYDGKIHAMPEDYMVMVLFYNTDMYKAAGLDPEKPPTTWDEFLAHTQALTRDTNGDKRVDQWGIGLVGAKDPGFSLRFSSILWSFGGDYLTADGKHSALDTPEAKEAFTFFVELYTKYKVVPPGLTAMTPQDVRKQLAEKRVAMELGSGWTIPLVSAMNPDLKAAEIFKAAPIPAKRQQATTVWLSVWVINPHTKYPDQAWELLKFFTSKEMEVKWFVETGVTSSRKDVSEVAPEILNDKFAKVIASQLPYGKIDPQIKQWPEIINAITTSLQEAILGMKPAEKAVLEAHEKVNKTLAQ